MALGWRVKDAQVTMVEYVLSYSVQSGEAGSTRGYSGTWSKAFDLYKRAQ